MILIPVVLSFFVSGLVLWMLLSSRLKTVGLDYPNHRSMHTVPVPRTGGLSIIFGAAASFPFLGVTECYFFLLMVLLASISFIDDIYNLKISLRIVMHIIVTTTFMLIFEHDLGFVVALVVGTYLVWHTNLYNFMDGIDGLAGAMSLVGFGTLGGMALYQEYYSLAVLALALATAVIPFLIFNFSPAKIFMGDSGSIAIGFLSGALGVYGWLEGAWSLFFPLVLFSPFLTDASFTIFKRILQKKNIFLPHKAHYYQRIVRHGYSVKTVWLGFFLVMLLCAFLAVSIESLVLSAQISIFASLMAAFVVTAICLEKVLRCSETQST